MGLFTRKPKKATFKGTALIAFNSEKERMDAAVDTFLWIRDYLEASSLEQDKRVVREIASYFYEIPKDMRRLGMTDYQWKDFNNMLFWLVYVASTSSKEFFFGELNQRVMARMLEGRFYGDEPIEHQKIKSNSVDKEYVREVIAAFEYEKTLCFNYWKYYK